MLALSITYDEEAARGAEMAHQPHTYIPFMFGYKYCLREVSIMSKSAYHQTDDKTSETDAPHDVPSGNVQDSSYVTRGGRKDPFPVQSDDAPVEDNIAVKGADSDEKLSRCLRGVERLSDLLEQQATNALDESGMRRMPLTSPTSWMRGRGRQAHGNYREPSDAQMRLTE